MKLPTKGDLIMIGNEYKNLKYKPEIKPHMLKWVRLSRNLTQSDVAAKLSVSKKWLVTTRTAKSQILVHWFIQKYVNY
ncbi:hypothetical protein [Bacillus toyonensis]|uniref:hypothetical protein n=1 Tax=Bacillus toyonensis TaxID=155322 RepID=UPI00211DA1A4|nr:hypothetical protein [Bacillus toyonensis]